MVTNTFTKNDTQTLMTAYTDGLINYGMTAGQACTAHLVTRPLLTFWISFL
jgi:hypothetical protein